MGVESGDGGMGGEVWLELDTSSLDTSISELRKMKFTGNVTKIIEDLMRVRVVGGKVKEEDEMYLITSGKLAIEQAILKLADDSSLSEFSLSEVHKQYRRVYPKKK